MRSRTRAPAPSRQQKPRVLTILPAPHLFQCDCNWLPWEAVGRRASGARSVHLIAVGSLDPASTPLGRRICRSNASYFGSLSLLNELNKSLAWPQIQIKRSRHNLRALKARTLHSEFRRKQPSGCACLSPYCVPLHTDLGTCKVVEQTSSRREISDGAKSCSSIRNPPNSHLDF